MINLTKRNSSSNDDVSYKLYLNKQLKEDLEYIAKKEGSKTLAPFLRMELTRIRNEKLPLYKKEGDSDD